MPFLILVFSALVGFVLGHFLAVPVLVAISLLALYAMYHFRPRREHELVALLEMVIVWYIGIGLVVMWLTYLFVTDFTALSQIGLPHLGGYILRGK